MRLRDDHGRQELVDALRLIAEYAEGYAPGEDIEDALKLAVVTAGRITRYEAVQR